MDILHDLKEAISAAKEDYNTHEQYNPATMLIRHGLALIAAVELAETCIVSDHTGACDFDDDLLEAYRAAKEPQ